MFEMADIHCHMLGGVDDGAKNHTEMYEMMDMAYADGIRHICFTPHFKIYHFKSASSIEKYNQAIAISFDAAVEYAREKYPDLKLYLGNEVMYHSEVIESSESNHFKNINGGSYFLVEFQPEVSVYDMRNAIRNILRKGYRPVIAHVERYAELYKKPDFVRELREYGALFQVNASSVAKIRFGKTASFIKSLFKRSYVDVIATDAHSTEVYTPIMSEAAKKIARSYGDEVAKKVCLTNPLAIINGIKLF